LLLTYRLVTSERGILEITIVPFLLPRMSSSFDSRESRTPKFRHCLASPFRTSPSFLCSHLSFSLASVLLIYTLNQFRSTLARRPRVFRKFHFRHGDPPISRDCSYDGGRTDRCRCRDNFFLEMSIGAHAVYPVASSNASDVLRLMVRQKSHTDSLIRFAIGFRPFDKDPRYSCDS